MFPAEGYTALGPALAEVDLRVGGAIRSRYRADGVLGDAKTIENVILAFEPPRMIALRIQKIRRHSRSRKHGEHHGPS